MDCFLYSCQLEKFGKTYSAPLISQAAIYTGRQHDFVLESSTGLGSNPAPHSSPCDLWPVTYFLHGSVPQIQERK